jgi:hypothetical protein
MELPADVAERLRAAYRATGSYFRSGAIFMGAVLVMGVLLGAMRGLWWLVLISVVFFGGLIAVMLVLARRYDDPSRSPVMRALFDAPDQIRSLKVVTQSSVASNRPEFLQIRLVTGEHLALRFTAGVMTDVRGALADRSPRAELDPPMPVPRARAVERSKR